MAHRKRERFVGGLLEQLPDRTEVVWDRRNDRWDTGRRALLEHDPEATHHLVLQDDVILGRQLTTEVKRALQVIDTSPIALYLGKARPRQEFVEPAVRMARSVGACWIAMPGPWWGPGLVIPTQHIEEMVAFCDNMTLPNYDLRISAWYESQRMDCWYTQPSLVDHRRVSENPSLCGRVGDRRAWWFIGTGPSPEVDWRSGVIRRGQTGTTTDHERQLQFLEVVEAKGLRYKVPKGAWVTLNEGGKFRIGDTVLRPGKQWVSDPFVVDRAKQLGSRRLTVEEEPGLLTRW
jgi:hypothetical protein